MSTDRQPVAIEVAETRDGKTAAESHLRAHGTRLTICGLPTPDETWFPVTNSEADQFGSCDGCAKFASRYRVASRPVINARPISVEAENSRILRDLTGFAPSGYIDLASAVAQTLFERLDGKAVVPQSVLWEIVKLSGEISQLRRPGHPWTASEAASIDVMVTRIREALQPFLGAEPDRMTVDTQ